MPGLSPSAGAGPAFAGCCADGLTDACPVDCLGAVLCTVTFHALVRAERAPFDVPATVGQVVDLWRAGRLRLIAGLGKRRLGEIEVALVVNGYARRAADPP